MKLFYHPMSQPSRAVKWFATNNGITLEYVVIDLMTGQQFSPEFSAKTPYNSVPVLELDDGTILTESGAILAYLADANGKNEEYPTEPLQRAKVLEALLHHEGLGRQVTLGAVRPLLAKLKKPDLAWEVVAESLKKTAPEYKYALSIINGLLSKSKFIAGEKFTIADYLLISELNQIEHADHIWAGVDEGCQVSNFAAIERYLADAQSLPNYAVNVEPLKQFGPMIKMVSSPL